MFLRTPDPTSPAAEAHGSSTDGGDATRVAAEVKTALGALPNKDSWNRSWEEQDLEAKGGMAGSFFG